MTESEIVWEEPPRKAGQSLFAEALEAVREREGEWARLRLYDSQGAVYRARRKLIDNHASEDPRWEFRVGRQDGNGRYGLYARYRTKEQMRAKMETMIPLALALATVWDLGFCCEWTVLGIDMDAALMAFAILVVGLLARSWSARRAFLREATK